MATEVQVFTSSVNGGPPREDVIVRFNSDGSMNEVFVVPSPLRSGGMTNDGKFIYIENNSSIEKFDRNGNWLGTFANIPNDDIVGRLQSDPLGNFYANDIQGNGFVIDNQGNTIFQVDDDFRGISGDVHGNVFGAGRNVLKTYDLAGNVVDSVPTTFEFAGDIAIDHVNATLYLGNGPGQIGVYDISSGRPVLDRTFDISNLTDTLFWLTYDPNTTNLFVGSIGPSFQITPDGDLVETYFTPEYIFTGGITVLPVPVPGTGFLGVCGLIWFVGRARRAIR